MTRTLIDDDGTAVERDLVFVVPCGGAKLDQPAPARDLYTGPMFRHTLAAAQAQIADGGRVLILSALHGLVEMDTVLDPYDLRMGQDGSVSVEDLAEQAEKLGLVWPAEVYGFLPIEYRDRLDAALRTHNVYLQDVYEATGGIGDQRHVNAVVRRPLPSEKSAAA